MPLNACDPEAVAVSLAGRPGLVWLDGDASHSEESRWSFLASDPVEVRRSRFGDESPLSVLATLNPTAPEAHVEGPRAERVPRWIGYVAYDATWASQPRTPPRISRAANASVVWLGRYDAVVGFEPDGGPCWLVGDDASACERLRARIAEGRRRPRPEARLGVPIVDPRIEHEDAIHAALEHIARGDIYQVNLARRWVATFQGSALALWLAMRRASPVPLGMYLDAGDHAVLARTMERFIRWTGPAGRLWTRPIKGTIARHGDDASEARTLSSDAKERAEHAMIVDLMRNDLGRVAEVGTVRVESPMVVEPYARLSHLVSTVTCQTRADVTLADVMDATFPPGSVTGAPKIRAIEIIEQLEHHPRGVYTGCVGYVDRAGGASFAVAIRTAQIRDGRVEYHAGGGLVSASVPSREVAETELKARVFLEAAQGLSTA